MERDFGKYELIEKIGTGGMAEVFLAKSFGAEGLEKVLVLKRILPEFTNNRRFVEMFISEAKIGVGLNHPNIVQIYDFGKVDETYFLAMEFVDGADLAQIISATKETDELLNVGDSLYCAIEIAKGLDYAHRRVDRQGTALNIVHRDISPQNILISRDGSVKVVDFGIAKASSVAEQSPHLVKGKFSYMSPEQASGRKVDQRSDVFAVGVVLFELLCGRPLFRHTTQEETLGLVKSAVVPDVGALNPKVPEALQEVLYRVLSKDARDRPQSARDLQVELTKILYSMGEVHDSATLAIHFAAVEKFIRGADSGSSTALASGLAAYDRVSTGVVTAPGGTMVQTQDAPVTRIANTTQGVPDFHARERKECVIVSGRLTGLFALRQAIGQDQWLQVLQEYTRIVDSIAYKNDAVVHRVNEDGFVILLGVPVSSDNDAETAARVSMDLQEAVAGMNPSLSAPIQLSVGIAIGDVLLEQEVDKTGRRFSWSFFGLAHELADKLARVAMVREIVLGGQVYRRIRRVYNCSRVDNVRFQDEAEEPQQIQAYLLTGLKSQQDRIHDVRRSYHAFHGREISLKALREGFREALVENEPVAMVVVGPTGIGKSTLVEEFIGSLDPRNIRILRGVVPPYEQDVPLACLASLLGEMMRLGDRADLRLMRSTLSQRIAALFPKESQEEQKLLLHSIGSLFNISFPESPFTELTGDERRDRVFLSIQKLITFFAAKKPLLLVIDDAHFMDTMTLHFVDQIIRGNLDVPVVTLLVADQREALDSVEWRALFSRERVTVEELGELGEAEANALVRELLRSHRIHDEELINEILEHSGGNPLFIKEVVEVLRDRGILQDSGERRHLGDEDSPQWLPSSVDGLLRARIDRLPLRLKVALQKVALLWSPFTVDDSELVLDEEAGESLDLLVEHNLLERADQPIGAKHDTYDPHQTPIKDRCYRFCNSLTQDVASKGLLPEISTGLHRRLANHLLEVKGEPIVGVSALIARHFDGAGESERSVEFYFQAADRALDLYGAGESLRLCEKVLERVEDGSRIRYDALKIRATALDEIGKREKSADTLYELKRIAEGWEDKSELCDILLRLARYEFDISDIRKARSYAAEAQDLSENAGALIYEANAGVFHALLDLHEGARDRALTRLEKAIESYEILEGAAALEGLVIALNLRGVINRQAGRHAEALESYYRALKYAEEANLGQRERYLLTNIGIALAYLGEFDQAIARYEEALKRSRSLGHVREESGLLINLGHADLLRGAVGDAITSIRRGIYLARKTNSHHILADGMVTLGAAYLESEELDKSEAALHEGLRIADSVPNVYLSVQATLLLAQIHLVKGTSDAAQISLMQAEDAVERSEGAKMRWGVAYGSMLMARALKVLGKREQAIARSKIAVELVNEGEIYAIDEILYFHVEILPDDEEHRKDRIQAVTRAREVVLYRRDLLPDEEAKALFMSRSINRKILAVAKLLSNS